MREEQISLVSNKGEIWNPVTGDCCKKVLESFFTDEQVYSRDKVKNESLKIISRCGPPGIESFKSTVLVYGLIQSGKTLSFTTVTALARDNNYQIVIILAGLTHLLVDQTFDRLHEDLKIGHNNNIFNKEWELIKIAGGNFDEAACQNQIEEVINEWNNDSINKRTVLITVMKNSNIKKLNSVLEKIDLEGVPTLIIDDEADQASLNNLERKNSRNAEDEESPTFKEIVALRNIIPHHTLLQYTATPQANLFQHCTNELAPDYAALVNPGEGYTGGEFFFLNGNDKKYIRIIEEKDIDINQEMPDSLIKALQIFYITAVDGSIKGRNGNRTMMIHPAVKNEIQKDYEIEIRETTRNWIEVLGRENSDETKQDLILDFSKAYGDLRITEEEDDKLSSFDELSKYLADIIKHTPITVLNSKQGFKVNWDNNYSHIVIGGNKLARGYTVKDLTVTYMPRSLGMGNIDTIQQRARFFGYKNNYKNYCRIFLDTENFDLFSEYAEKEIKWRRTIGDLEGKPLSEWDQTLDDVQSGNWTRPDVLPAELLRYKYGKTWTQVFSIPDQKSNEVNRLLLSKLKSNNSFNIDSRFPDRNEDVKNSILSTKLFDFYNNFLVEYKLTDEDHDFSQAIKKMSDIIALNPDEKVDVYLMSQGKLRKRSMYANRKIRQLFQGSDTNDEKIYPGDKKAINQDNISVQIHNLHLFDHEKNSVEKHVPIIAIWFPENFNWDLIKPNF